MFAAEYEGSSVDQTDPNPTTFIFRKSDEIRAVGGLQQDILVSSVEMSFQDSTTWDQESFAGDPQDWVTVTVRNNPRITIFRTTDNLVVTGTDHFEFKVKPVTSGTQTLWEIVRWNELHGAP